STKGYSSAASDVNNRQPEFVLAHRHVVVPIAPEDTEAFDRHYATLKAITNDSENSHLYHAICFELVAFFFRTTYKCYRSFSEQVKHQKSFVSQQFLLLAQTHFRHERFLDFYAAQLGLTKKHMSRTVKEQTGYTAVEWIERFIILEAKVMLKSSTLTIQQIAEELHFPSQSLFGKYFKKNVGMTPKEYRNH
ncbi:MAG: helix-turn-helix domain-containing protein, partial [Muribaculaceae bacterium]|nr:helix-turn-helix domain-containing protein [Muribaculaceae bacterium]